MAKANNPQTGKIVSVSNGRYKQQKRLWGTVVFFPIIEALLKSCSAQLLERFLNSNPYGSTCLSISSTGVIA
jgi:hypothetical protein